MIAGGAEVFETTAAGTATIVTVNDRGAKLLREQDIIHGAPIFNARFFTRELIERVGPLDTRWRRSRGRRVAHAGARPDTAIAP